MLKKKGKHGRRSKRIRRRIRIKYREINKGVTKSRKK
jgi:hypothetical protein